MANMSAEWEKSTPKSLIPAIRHIRNSFDKSQWKFSQITEKLCYSGLHPRLVSPTALAPYEDAFAHYRNILDAPDQRQLDDTVRIGTPPAIFKAHLDALRSGLKVEVRQVFTETLRVALANVDVLKTHPVEWTKCHLVMMTRKQLPLVVMWIKRVCDEQEYGTMGATDAGNEALFWNTWRAPRLVYMKPSGNLNYDPATAWMREDEQHTKQLLKALSTRFIQFLELSVENIAGAEHVAHATRDATGAPGGQIRSRPTQQEFDNETGASQTKASPAGAKPHIPEKVKVGPKKQDLSHYLDSAKLTTRQRDCMSLLFEHEMGKTDIARHLGIDRKTLDEHLAAAERRLRAARTK